MSSKGYTPTPVNSRVLHLLLRHSVTPNPSTAPSHSIQALFQLPSAFTVAWECQQTLQRPTVLTRQCIPS